MLKERKTTEEEKRLRGAHWRKEFEKEQNNLVDAAHQHLDPGSGPAGRMLIGNHLRHQSYNPHSLDPANFHRSPIYSDD